jgi:DNA-binding MarR family transcriptional regulator
MPLDTNVAGLVVLLSEKYTAVRKRCEQLWRQEGLEEISASEWYILSQIDGHEPSVSEIARMANISRQAAHKFIRGLQNKGLLKINRSPKNNRDKLVQFTALGKQCVAICMMTERNLESEISSSIGADKIDLIKNILSEKWFQ